MKAPPLSYIRAQNLDDVFLLRADAGPQARLLAGGQSLLASLAFRLSDPGTLIDIGRVEELKGIAVSAEGDLVVGALTTHSELARNLTIRARLPVLARAAQLIAHPAIRNRGTIGGSLAFADPAAELPALCLALEAQIVAASPGGERRIAAADFFTGLFGTALAADELIRAVEFPAIASERRAVILELARRHGDYAMAGIVLSAGIEAGRLLAPRPVFFALGDRPQLAPAAAALLEGALLDGAVADPASIASAQAALEDDLDPPADLHGDAAMKRHLARVLLARALAALAANDAENGP